MQRLLVTGASGVLGSSLAAAAARLGREVTGVSFRHPIALAGVKSVAADLTRRDEAERVLEHAQPECVIHCAAATDVDWCEDHPQEARQANVEMPRLLAAAARRSGAGFLYVSTDAVFDGERGNYSEQDEPGPVNRYAQTKLEGEQAAQEESGGCLVARLSLYGWNPRRRSKPGLAEWVVANLESGQPMPGFQDVIFTPLYTGHLSEILLTMTDRRLSGVYHVGSSEACSKYDFAVSLAKALGRDPSLVRPARLEDVPLRARRAKNTSLCTAKLRAALGQALPDVHAGIQRFKAERQDPAN